jgi:hypothetical protein
MRGQQCPSKPLKCFALCLVIQASHLLEHLVFEDLNRDVPVRMGPATDVMADPG